MMPTERTAESYTRWLAESPREVDAWVHETVFGVDRECSDPLWESPRFYTSDANAADLVRERVAMLERDFQVSWVYRVAVLSMQSGMMVDAMIHARPPHYVGAAWLLGDEVWRELRERGTITP